MTRKRFLATWRSTHRSVERFGTAVMSGTKKQENVNSSPYKNYFRKQDFNITCLSSQLHIPFAFTWVQWQSSWPCPANPRLSEATSYHLPEYLIGSKFFAVMPLIIISFSAPSSEPLSSGRVTVFSAAFASSYVFLWRQASDATACSKAVKGVRNPLAPAMAQQYLILFHHYRKEI